MESDLPHFDKTRCGDMCHKDYHSNDVFFCEKGQLCCPKGADDEICSKKCGPYDKKGNLLVYYAYQLPSSWYFDVWCIERQIFRLVITETFGTCEPGSTFDCCEADAVCNVDCDPDGKCRYADRVFTKKSCNYFLHYLCIIFSIVCIII